MTTLTQTTNQMLNAGTIHNALRSTTALIWPKWTCCDYRITDCAPPPPDRGQGQWPRGGLDPNIQHRGQTLLSIKLPAISFHYSSSSAVRKQPIAQRYYSKLTWYSNHVTRLMSQTTGTSTKKSRRRLKSNWTQTAQTPIIKELNYNSDAEKNLNQANP